jgi:predicted GNAT family acetyltransferase
MADLSDAPELTVVDDTGHHRFELRADGELAAFTQYRVVEAGVYAFTHTQTLSRFTGRGLASTLIRDVLDRMRAENHHILPYCPFVNAYLRSHPEYADLVPAADRRQFGVAE